jgi:stress response protein YsnF
LSAFDAVFHAVHVTGGVRVRKTEGVDTETIQKTVRREDVDVDESGKTARREKGINEEKL